MTRTAGMTNQQTPPGVAAGHPEPGSLADDARGVLDAAVDQLLSRQHDDGHWCAELEGDSILQSEWALLKWILDEEDDPRLPGVVAHLRTQQRPDGAWAQYPGGRVGGGKFDLSATVKAYFVLKLAGDDPEAEHMRKARELILAHGGAERCNTFSKYYLAALGQVGYDAVPTIPPQLVFLPRWFYFHLNKVSAWSRTMIVPLSIVTARKPLRSVQERFAIAELFVDPANRHRLIPTGFGGSRFWTRLFLAADQALKLADRIGLLKLGQAAAIRRMADWIKAHCEGSDGPGAIFPPIVYTLIVLRKCLGYDADHPLVRDNHRHLDHYFIYGTNGSPRNRPEDSDDDLIRIQPCESPTWDTGIAAYALVNAGLRGDHPAMRRCADWLVSKECRQPGDWLNNLRGKDRQVPFSGWFFEYNNPMQPDLDDTVMVSMALRKMAETGAGEDPAAASSRSFDWIRVMQNDDGGWAAFDKGAQGRDILENVPFADHNALQDPSCPDITGRTLECLGHHGVTADDPNVQRAISFIKATQEPDGCWFGRWGVNYLYGTWQVLGGLERVGCDMRADWVQKAGQWLLDHQKPDGSFGESPDTYEDPALRGTGPSTASQTAWAAMALMNVYGPNHEAVHRAIHWLCQTQTPDGNWDEPWFTGTGFPKVFYLRYHFYRLYFPIMAIGRWLDHEQRTAG